MKQQTTDLLLKLRDRLYEIRLAEAEEQRRHNPPKALGSGFSTFLLLAMMLGIMSSAVVIFLTVAAPSQRWANITFGYALGIGGLLQLPWLGGLLLRFLCVAAAQPASKEVTAKMAKREFNHIVHALAKLHPEIAERLQGEVEENIAEVLFDKLRPHLADNTVGAKFILHSSNVKVSLYVDGKRLVAEGSNRFSVNATFLRGKHVLRIYAHDGSCHHVEPLAFSQEGDYEVHLKLNQGFFGNSVQVKVELLHPRT